MPRSAFFGGTLASVSDLFWWLVCLACMLVCLACLLVCLACMLVCLYACMLVCLYAFMLGQHHMICEEKKTTQAAKTTPDMYEGNRATLVPGT